MNLQSAKRILKYAATDGQLDEVIKLAIEVVLEHLPEPTPLPATFQFNGEIWRDVRGYEGLYQVSNFGRVRSFHNSGMRILSPSKVKGYLCINLFKDNKAKNFKVHRLVAQAFLPNPDNLPQVDHINTDKTDNRVENLQWVTGSENVKLTYQRGRTVIHGENVYNAKLTTEKVAYIRENPDGLTQRQLAKKFNVCQATIGQIQRGETWKV